MKNLFAKAIAVENIKTATEKGGNAFKTAGKETIDLFATIGSLRERDEQEIEDKFARAYAENPLLSLKMAFYLRNVRGGLGERRSARIIFKWIANNHPNVMIGNLAHIPRFGRWDDLYSLVGTPVEPYMWTIVAYQFLDDIKHVNTTKNVSLLGKWLKSANASSLETRELGRMTANKLGLSPKEYRQSLSKLRAKKKVVEVKMSARNWSDIDFGKVPSKAMTNYRNAFAEHQPERFEEFMKLVAEGKTDIHSGTLFPYEILERMQLSDSWEGNFEVPEWDEVLEEQWKALPNYVEEPVNFLVMADTSGSMHGRPMATSISLAIYFAERNQGAFHNQFMTFSSEPKFVELKGNNLKEKIQNIESIVDSTDLEKAFTEILLLAANNSIPKEDMPKSLIVISDGEIDSFNHSASKWSFLDNMEARFAEVGYDLPTVVMWNVNARAEHFIDTIRNENIQFISGSSPSAFKSLIAGKSLTAEELMIEVLDDPMYAMIEI